MKCLRRFTIIHLDIWDFELLSALVVHCSLACFDFVQGYVFNIGSEIHQSILIFRSIHIVHLNYLVITQFHSPDFFF